MADLLVDFETYFVSKNIATTVYKDTAPDAPNSLIALYEHQGTAFMPQIDGAMRSIQFVVRDASAAKAKTKAKDMYNTLITEDGLLNLTEQRWCLISISQPPFRMKTDEAGRVYYAFNANVTTYID